MTKTLTAGLSLFLLLLVAAPVFIEPACSGPADPEAATRGSVASDGMAGNAGSLVPSVNPDGPPGAIGSGAAPTATPAGGVEAPVGRYEEVASPRGADSPSAAAPNLISSVDAPPISTGFAGIGMQPDSGGFVHSPPDTHAAAGPDRIVEITNGHVAIYNKSGGIIAGGDTGVGALDLNGFCSGELNNCFDPKVIYDQYSGRFVAVVLEGNTNATSFLHVMASKTSAPGNLTTDWDKLRHAAGAVLGGAASWFDYPGLGVSPGGVVVSGNMFDSTGNFQGTKIRIFDKVELYDGDATATFVDINTPFLSGADAGSGFTIHPAHHFGSSPAGTFYLIQRWDFQTLRVRALTGVPGSPVLSSSSGFVATADQGDCAPELQAGSVPQAGTAKTLDPVCPRMMNAVWRSGSLWATLTGSDFPYTRTKVQWFQVSTAGYPPTAPTLTQHGVIDGGSGEHTFMPSISVDGCGNAALTYTQSSATAHFPEMRYTGRLAGDPLNTMQAPVIAKTSVSFYDDFTGLPTRPNERWGDYSATVIDPSDQSLWVVNEYARVAASGAGNDGRWGTWFANFTFSCVIPDGDGDGWNNASENTIGTDPLDACADTTTPNDERGPAFGEPVPPWPPDFNDDRFITGADLSTVAGVIGQNAPPAPVRRDISQPPDGAISGADLSAVAGRIGAVCTP